MKAKYIIKIQSQIIEKYEEINHLRTYTSASFDRMFKELALKNAIKALKELL
jgi:hypothetical protein